MKSKTDNRSAGRSNVFLTATLDTGDGSIPVRIRNLSAKGALIDGPALPSAGASVRLLRGRLSAAGELAWEAAGQAGVTFGHEIKVDDWVQRSGHAGQERVDGVISALRRSASLPEELQAVSNIASLASISAALDEVCERVAAMPNMSVELGEELLKLDAIAHSLRRAATDN
ncbi:MAG: PilZ domain-containing protein [Sphingomicrobium sp.]